MSRVLVCSSRVGEDKKENDQVLYISTWKMPTYTSKGFLWYPKKDESIVNIVIRRSQNPQSFEQYKTIKPGALLDVYYAVNETTAKAYVDRFELIPGTDVHKIEDIYLNPYSVNKNEKISSKKSVKESVEDLPF